MQATPDPDDEAALIARAKAGDGDARDELFRRHFDGVHAWVRLKRSDLLRERESSLDVVQSMFKGVLTDLEHFEYRGRNSFRNWLLTYAENKLRNREQYFRAERRQPGRESEESLSMLYASVCSPTKIASAREQVELFEGAFAQLAASDQQLILMARIEGLSHAQIAARLGTTEAASKKALSRAMVRLASRMTAAS